MHLRPFLQIFGCVAVLFTLVPLIAMDYWWVSLFDFLHIQLTILTLVALLVYFFRFEFRFWEDYVFILILTGCFVFQLQKIYPYTPFPDHEVGNNETVNPNASLSLLVANVLQENKKTEKVLDEILRTNPNLVVLMETNARWMNELSPALRDRYPYKVEVPLDNTYGMLFYSTFELMNPEVRYLVNDSIPSLHTLFELPTQQKIELHIIHPTPPMPQHNPSSTNRDAQMMMVAKMAKGAEFPVIVTGDFNDVAWSGTTSLFQNVSGLLDPRIGRGFYNTFNANSWILRWPLDHLFVSEEFRMVDLNLGNDIGSDHFPFYAKMTFEPEKAAEQKTEGPTKEQLKTANQTIEKAKEDAKENSEKEKL